MTNSLAYIRKLIANKGALDLGEDTVGPDSYALLTALFKQQEFHATQITNVQESVDRLAFAGTFPTLYHWQNVPAKFCFMDISPDSSEPKERHILFQFDLPEELNVDALLTAYRSGVDPATLDDELPETVIDSYLETIEFTRHVAIFSSLDYQPSLESHYPASFSLPADQIKTGLNFAVDLSMVGDVMTFLEQIFGGQANESVTVSQALIYQGETDPYFSLGRAFTASKTIAPFTFTLNRISLSNALVKKETDIWPQFLVDGAITVKSKEFAINAALDLDTLELTVNIAEFPTLAGWIELIDLRELNDYFPESLASLLNIQLSELKIVLDLTNQSVSGISLELTTANEIELLEGITFLPVLTMSIFSPFDQINRLVEGELKGDWQLGSTRFVTKITYPDFTLSAEMVEGDTLDVDALMEKILAGADLPDIELTKMALQGNYKDKSFSVNLAVAFESEWSIVEGSNFLLKNLELSMIYADQEREYSLSGKMKLGGVDLDIFANHRTGAGWQFGGSAGPIEIGRLIQDLPNTFGDVTLPSALESLTLERVVLLIDTGAQRFFFGCRAQLKVDDNDLDMNLAIDIQRQTGFYKTRFGGDLTIGGLLFTLEFSADKQSKSFSATFINSSNKPIDLKKLINQISKDVDLDTSEFGLNTLTISELALTVVTGASKMYSFRGVAEWDTGIVFVAGEESLKIQAAVFLKKEGTNPLSGEISGAVSSSIPYFENLNLGAVYKFGGQEKDLVFKLQLGSTLTLEASYEKETDGDKILTFRLSEGNLTFGDILTFLVGLVDSSIDEFQLDPPWDLLDRIPLAGISLVINLTKKSAQISYPTEIKLAFGTISSVGMVYHQVGIPKKSRVDITLQASILGGESKTLDWDALNQAPPQVPGHGAAMFDLQYLGVGQHVSITNIQNLTTITEIMTALRGSALPLLPAEKTQNPLTALAKRRDGGQPTTSIVFNAQSGMFFGAQMSLLKMIDLWVIFNDPFVYGLRIELSGEGAKKFAGLKFEILYRKITPTIGVYHGELTLPDAMRYLQFGAVSITLPVVVLDIYTNGDFKIDVGFPWNGDWSRSAAAEVGVFTGAGGFYFNKLSAETATSVPKIINGKFDPVLEFGLGLKIGMGRTFDKGPLHAELSITVQGIVQGVLAWFNPNDISQPKDQYYLIKGGVSVVGRVYGKVDFEVIVIDIEVIARATVLFVVESYKPIYLTLEAEVSVRASVTIVFITIKFSFYLRISESFTIGSAKPTPWILGISGGSTTTQTDSELTSHLLTASTPQQDSLVPTPRLRLQPQSFASTLTENSAAPQAVSANQNSLSLSEQLTNLKITQEREPRTLSWQPVKIWWIKKHLDIYFQPGFTRSMDGVNGVALLFMENSIPVDVEHPFDDEGNDLYANTARDTTTDFDYLLYGLLGWAMYAYYTQPAASDQLIVIDENTAGEDNFNYIEIKLTDLKDLYTAFIAPISEKRENNNARFAFDRIIFFLMTNYDFKIAAYRPEDETAKSATIFPMFPQLRMELRVSIKAGNTLTSITAASQSFTVENLVENNLNTSGLISPEAPLVMTSANETFQSLAGRLKETNLLEVNQTERITIKATKLASVAKITSSALLIPGQKLKDPNNPAGNGIPVSQNTSSLNKFREQYNKDHPDKTISVAALIEANWTKAGILDSGVTLFDTKTGETFNSLHSRILEEFHLEQFSLEDLTAMIKDMDGLLVVGKSLLLPQSPNPVNFNALELEKCENLFVDYFKLLIRATVQSAIDFMTESGLNEIILKDLLDGLNQGGQFSHIAAMTSRFLLHGHRVADDSMSLYRATGQQFHVLHDDFEIALSLDKDTIPSDFISFADASLEELVYTLRQKQEVEYIQGLRKISNLPFVVTDNITLLPYYEDVSVHFTLLQKTVWQAILSADQTSTSSYSIIDLPQDLQAYLLSKGRTGNLALKTTASGKGNAKSGDNLKVADYDNTPIWATKVNLTVRRIISKDDSKDDSATLSHTYQMLGAAKSEKDLLEKLSDAAATLYLLYKAEGKTHFVNPLKKDEIVLLKSNLSISPTTYAADMGSAKNFIQLLLESSSVTSGGFYLHITGDDGLPDSLFTDGQNATLVLLANLNDGSDAHPFHNCIYLPGDIDLDSNILLVENEQDTIKVPSLQPGNLGFRYERSKPALVTIMGQLDNLYQLLSYRISATSFTQNQDQPTIQPIGPLPDDPLTSDDDFRWIYERVAPVYKLIQPGETENSIAEPDPYAAIASNARITFGFQWQDIYGNRLGNPAIEKTFDIRYTDPLIGINQWHSVAESYLFKKTETGAVLEIELAFDPSPYFGSRDELDLITQKIEAALETYQQIYYQLRSDVTITIQSSMISGTHAIASSELKDLVHNIYLFLKSRETAPGQQITDSGVVLPSAFSKSFSVTPVNYDSEFIFPVTVQMDMARGEALVDTGLTADVPEIQQVTAFLSPKTRMSIGSQDEIASLRDFAVNFETAFDGLHLAVSDNAQSNTPIWAVHLVKETEKGSKGVYYNIREELPYFFSLPPLANTMLSGEVKLDSYTEANGWTGEGTGSKRFEAIDINVLARAFLSAVEAFLDPAIMAPARSLNPSRVEAILGYKKTLAEKISNQLDLILAQADSADITNQKQAAVDAYRQQLLVNLLEAYEIETVIQYNVDVEVKAKESQSNSSGQLVAVLSGQPVAVVEDASVLPEFTLSSAKAPLNPGRSHLTFFFNTQSPEKFEEDTKFKLSYKINEIGHDIVNQQASAWLTFINPIESPMGELTVPVPLRTYPMPPSLALHKAKADPDSVENLKDIRQWQYEFTYEHLDVAQDAIECQVDYNVVTTLEDPRIARNTSNIQDPLFAALINFTELYPEILKTLQKLEVNTNSNDKQAIGAIAALETLIRKVTTNWGLVTQAGSRIVNTTQYVISETVIGNVNPTDTNNENVQPNEDAIVVETVLKKKSVTIEQNPISSVDIEHIDFHMPGYKKQITLPIKVGNKWAIEFVEKTAEEAALDPIYGESSIPDRTLFIQDLDIIHQQNAWATIWLTRNKELISDRQTNPKFIYQTPQVRFGSAVTPLLENNQHWDLGQIDSRNPLETHIERFFTTILPDRSNRPYDIRVSCRYAFSLASGINPGEELISTLPVVLGPRFTIRAGKDLLSETLSFRTNFAIAINTWKNKFKPLMANGRYIFSISLFKADDLTLINGILNRHIDLLGNQKIKTFIDLTNASDSVLSGILGSSMNISTIKEQAQTLADSTGENINLPLIKIDHLELRL